MILLHAISSLDLGGAERQLGILGSAQARAGHEVHVAVVRGGPHAGILERAGVIFHRLPHGSNIDPRLIFGMRSVIQAVRPAVMQTWLTQMDVVGGIAARTTGTPWVLAERSSAAAYPPAWRQRIRSRIARGADRIVANSVGGADYWEEQAPAVPRQVIGNAVAIERIRSAEVTPLPPGAVLFVGRLASEKRVASLLRGYARTKSTAIGPLFLCGDGYERNALEQLTRALDLEDRVTFLGLRDDVWSLMRGATVVVNPSAFEGCPNAVIEAMAASRPVVASDIAAHREFLDDETALLVDAEQPDALASALVAAAADSPATRERVVRADVRVQRFGVDAIRHAFDAVYDDVLTRRAGRKGS